MTKRIRRFRSPIVALGAVVLPVLACGGGDKKPADAPPPPQQGYNSYPPQQQGYPPPQGYPQQPPQGQQGYPPPQPSQPPPQPQAFPPPQPQPTGSAAPLPGAAVPPDLLSQIAAAGAAILANPSGGLSADPVEIGVKFAAQRFAPGMQPEGQMAKDQLAENGHKEMMISLQGGKCYTIIGFSPLGGIRNLDLHLLAPPFYNIQAGQDDSTDNTAVIGKGNSPLCPITPFPLQYKLDIHSRAGAGQVGVQVFSKNK